VTTSAVAAELDRLAELGSQIGRLPPPNRRDPEAWHVGRDFVSREIARSIGRLRQELGIHVPLPNRAPEHQLLRARGTSAVAAGGRQIPVVVKRSRAIVTAVAG